MIRCRLEDQLVDHHLADTDRTCGILNNKTIMIHVKLTKDVSKIYLNV